MPEPRARSRTVFRRGDVGVSQNRGFPSTPQILLVSEGLYREIIIRSPKKVGLKGSRLGVSGFGKPQTWNPEV